MAISRHSGATRPSADRARWIPVLIAALVIGSQLLVNPIVGLADNGDFANVANTFVLFHQEPRTADVFFDYLVQTWGYDGRRVPEVRLLTSEWFLVAPSILAVVYGLGATYDLRWTGATHLSVFLAALYWLYPVLAKLPRPPRLTAWALLLVAFCDVSYFSYFNSFYVDAASLLFLLLMLTFYLRLASDTGNARRNALAFLLASGLFLFSKSQHALLFIVVAPLVWMDRRLAVVLTRKERAIATAVLGVSGVVCLQYTPPEYKAYAAYNVIFIELLPNSPNPREVLRELGLPESLEGLAGKDSFHVDSAMRNPALQDEVRRKLSHSKLLRYYLRHPSDAVRMIKAALEESALQRPKGFGNFTYSAGRPPNTISDQYAVWSDAKSWLFVGNPWLYATVIVILCIGALLFTWLRYRADLPAVTAVLAMISIEFFVSALADCRETTRHLFLFQAMIDLLFVFVAAHAIWMLMRVVEPLWGSAPMRETRAVSCESYSGAAKLGG